MREMNMTEIKQVYKCNICGNIVEVLHAGVGQLVCCGQPMELLTEKTKDVGLEKHVPVIETDYRQQGLQAVPEARRHARSTVPSEGRESFGERILQHPRTLEVFLASTQ